jgi:hypothetical protein
MKENTAQTEPAARLVSVAISIARNLPKDTAQLGRALDKTASRVMLMSLRGELGRPSTAAKARACVQRVFDIVELLDRMQAYDAGVLQKALTYADKVLRVLPEAETITSPLPPAHEKGQRPILGLIPLAAKGSHSP